MVYGLSLWYSKQRLTSSAVTGSPLAKTAFSLRWKTQTVPSLSVSQLLARLGRNSEVHPYPGVNDWYETVKLNYGVDYATGEKHFCPIPTFLTTPI